MTDRRRTHRRQISLLSLLVAVLIASALLGLNVIHFGADNRLGWPYEIYEISPPPVHRIRTSYQYDDIGRITSISGDEPPQLNSIHLVADAAIALLITLSGCALFQLGTAMRNRRSRD